MTTPDVMRLHAIVDGFVQGVGFRYYVEQTAVSLGLVGWVRNRYSGQVELLAEGDRLALEKLAVSLESGPRGSRVEGIDLDWQPATGEFSDFRIRSTA